MQIHLKRGDRIRLVSMPENPEPVSVGALGTVFAVHSHRDWTQVEVDWDSGGRQMLKLPEDCVAIVEPNIEQSS